MNERNYVYTHFATWSFHCASSVWPSNFETRLVSLSCSAPWHELFSQGPGRRDYYPTESSLVKLKAALPWKLSWPFSSCYLCRRVQNRSLPRTMYCFLRPRPDSELCRATWRPAGRIALPWTTGENTRRRRSKPNDKPFLWPFSPSPRHQRFDRISHTLRQRFWNIRGMVLFCVPKHLNECRVQENLHIWNGYQKWAKQRDRFTRHVKQCLS